MRIIFSILEIALLAYLAWGLVKLFMHLFDSIKTKDKKSILINSLLFILCALFYFALLDPIGRVSRIYQEIAKSF